MRIRTLIMVSVFSMGQLFVTTPCFPGGTLDPLQVDWDKDGLCNNCEEWIFKTDHIKPDTDEDGILDGDEDHNGDGLTNLEEQNNIEGLRDAISNGNIEGVIKLLDYYPYIPAIEYYHQTALTIAVKYGSSEIVQILLQAGADVAARDEYGKTALMQAAWYAHTEIAYLLLKAGADVNAQDDYGSTALMKAAGYADLEAVKFLLHIGAEVDARDNHGETALMYTLTHEVLELSKIPSSTRESADRMMAVVIKELVAAGAAVDATDNNGETTLMKAVRYRDIALTAIVSALLEAGAEVNNTVINIAGGYGHTGIVDLLLKAYVKE
jgi:hypothetical protein